MHGPLSEHGTGLAILWPEAKKRVEFRYVFRNGHYSAAQNSLT